MNSSTFAGALLAAGMLLAGPVAHAQPAAPPAGTATPAPAVPDSKLDAAATAIARVNAVSRQYEQRFEAAPPQDRARIADEADVALEKAVNDSGLSVDEYIKIIEIAQADPETHGKILQRLQRMPPQE